jgi:cobalt-zinc-cadmium efflux system protein
MPGVANLHDLHIWSLSTTEIAMTCHLVMQQGHPGDRFLHRLQDSLADLFQITHCTVQIEIDPEDAHEPIRHGGH